MNDAAPVALFAGDPDAPEAADLGPDAAALRKAGRRAVAYGASSAAGEDAAPRGALVAARAHLSLIAADPPPWLASLRAALAGGSPGFLGRLAVFGRACALAAALKRGGAARVHSYGAGEGADVAMIAARLAGVAFSFSLRSHAPFFAARAGRLDRLIAAADLVACDGDFARSQCLIFASAEDEPKIVATTAEVEHAFFAAPRPEGGAPLHVVAGPTARDETAFETIATAFARLRRIRPDARLTLIGAPKPMAEARIETRPLADPDAIAASFAEAHVFVEAGIGLSVSPALRRAMAAGLPCVAARAPGLFEAIRDGESGLVVPPADPEALAAALERLAEDAPLRDRLGAAARDAAGRPNGRPTLAALLR
ncbi:MAG: glycosyltransferase [Pseudomonadota bacterium]